MDTLVEMAIDLACQLQEDERYLAWRAAEAAADQDEALQQAIGEFNLKRMAINEEESKDEGARDADKLHTLHEEMRTVYGTIMQNEHMIAYQEKNAAVGELVERIRAAITLAMQGEDPHRAGEEGGCSGNCSACGGCH